jgi:hypothetical protein
MIGNTTYLGNDYIYTGSCSEIRVPGNRDQKDVFRGEELIEGKKYKLIGGMSRFVDDDWFETKNHERANYLRVKNEYEQEIYVNSIYFVEDE